MSKTLNIGEYVGIKEIVIDRKVQQLLHDNKNKSAIRWDSYRTMVFRIKGFDNDNLAVLMDANGNEIHISQKALFLTELNPE